MKNRPRSLTIFSSLGMGVWSIKYVSFGFLLPMCKIFDLFTEFIYLFISINLIDLERQNYRDFRVAARLAPLGRKFCIRNVK